MNKLISSYAHSILCEQEKSFPARKSIILKRMIKMARITAIIPDNLEKELRLKTLHVYGGRKGDLSKAVESAIKTWVTSEKLVKAV